MFFSRRSQASSAALGAGPFTSLPKPSPRLSPKNRQKGPIYNPLGPNETFYARAISSANTRPPRIMSCRWL